jgi:hypothetical protein
MDTRRLVGCPVFRKGIRRPGLFLQSRFRAVKTNFLPGNLFIFPDRLSGGKKRVSFPSEVKEFGISEKRTGRIL